MEVSSWGFPNHPELLEMVVRLGHLLSTMEIPKKVPMVFFKPEAV